MECIELSYPEIIRKSANHAATMGWLAAVALLSLMLWLSPAAPVSAQTLDGVPTSPCPVGGRVQLSGWGTVVTPDCSNTAAWYHRFADGTQEILSWALGNVPPTPGGHTTFVTLRAEDGQSAGPEGLYTVMRGFEVGKSYDFSIFFNANYVGAGRHNNYAQTCPVTLTFEDLSVPTQGGEGVGNTWVERRHSFVATGTTQLLRIQSGLGPNPTSGCLVNIYIPANAVVPSVVDADLQMTKTVSPTGAVASGSVLTYTLVARNSGPSAASNVLLRDTPSAGLNCTTPSPTATCSASGGATCPGATVPVSSLTGGGVAIPSMPVGGQVAVTMQCTVTATGR